MPVVLFAVLLAALSGDMPGVRRDTTAAESTRIVVPMLACSGCNVALFDVPTVDRTDTAALLRPGQQSTLSPASATRLETDFPSRPEGLAGVGAIFRWMASTFSTEPDGGRSIGQSELNSLLQAGVLHGCHDWVLVMASILRHFGYPSVMVDTAGIQWARDYAAGRTQDFRGHVFAEVLVDGRWLLVDCTSGRYTPDYDPANPVIGYPGGAGDAIGFFALFKGVDPAGYGVTSGEILRPRMEAFARALEALVPVAPAYRWQQLP